MHNQTDATGYADTHYTRTRATAVPTQRLVGPVEADVCIVGGGIAGISAAWQLQARGLTVVLLEARRLAWGASGRNGGMLSAGYARDLSKFAAQSGPKAARALYDISREGVQIVVEHTRTLGLQGVDPVPGVIAVSRYPDAAGMQAAQKATLRDYGHVKEYLSTRALRDLVKSERYHDGLFDPDGYHIHPLNYCLGLAADIAQKGGQLFENSAMVSMDLAGTDKIVRTRDGQVTARRVVLCGSGYSGREFGALRKSLLPIATYVVSTDALGARAEAILNTRAGISDTRLTCDYFRITPDGALLWGGGMSATAPTPPDLATRMKARIVDVFPQLADIDLAVTWTGLMGYAVHKMPYLQELSPGVWALTCLGGHGLNTGPALARVLAEAIAEDGHRHHLFRPFGLRWNGGYVGPLAADAIARTSDLRNALREWRGTRASA